MARRYSRGKRRQEGWDVADHGTEERWQHGGCLLILTETAGVLAARVNVECVLDRWIARGAISEEEYEAGLRLRQDYQMGQVPHRVSRVYTGLRPDSQASWGSAAERRCPRAELAYRHWREAVIGVGRKYRALLIAVCCEDASLPWAARAELREALQALEEYYRI